MSNHSQEKPSTNNRFAQTDQEADRRFMLYKSEDPFPEILPALLNSADIEDYLAVTGMIFPFDLNKLKSASYEVDLCGECFYWDEEGMPRRIKLEKDNNNVFTLKKNSIAFVNLEYKFRLPYYIALRFNLQITHVHRGILLGTGPLVDPGFEGKLLIPLHNLTNNDYEFNSGQSLIWIEFTKLSQNPKWCKMNAPTGLRQGKYKKFPEDKKNLKSSDYLEKAAGMHPVRSSIPGTLKAAQDSAEKAAQNVKSIRNKITFGGIVGVLALVVAFYPLGSLFLETFEYVRDAREELNTLKQEVEALQKKVDKLSRSQVSP